MKLGETKDIPIGKLTAYYDPEKLKENNPFCAIGFSDEIFLSLMVTGSPLVSYQHSSGHYQIDSDSLAVTMLGFTAPAGVVGQKFEY